MSKRKNLTTAAAFLCIAATAQIKQKPNILWIMAEDMGQDLECYGMKAVRTPKQNGIRRGTLPLGMLYSSNQFTKPLGNDDRSASNYYKRT